MDQAKRRTSGVSWFDFLHEEYICLFCKAHRASYFMGIGTLNSGVKRPGSEAGHCLNLVPSLRISGVMPPWFRITFLHNL